MQISIEKRSKFNCYLITPRCVCAIYFSYLRNQITNIIRFVCDTHRTFKIIIYYALDAQIPFKMRQLCEHWKRWFTFNFWLKRFEWVSVVGCNPGSLHKKPTNKQWIIVDTGFRYRTWRRFLDALLFIGQFTAKTVHKWFHVHVSGC